MKSKQKAFLSSLIPGMGHIYIGLKSRGALFILGFIFLISLANISSSFNERYTFIFQSFGLRRIIETFGIISYFASILDCMLCYDKIFTGKLDINDETSQKIENKKLLAMFLSVIPGCGHFIIGKIKKGKNILLIFLLLYLLSSIAGMEIFKIAIAVLIVICIYDIYTENVTLDKKDEIKEEKLSYNCRSICIAAGAILGIYTIVYCVTSILSYIGLTDIVTNINYALNIGMNGLVGIVISVVLIKEGYKYAEKREKELDATVEKEHQEEIDRESEENL